MEIRDETFQILYNLAEEGAGSPELYHTLVSFIQYQANEKKLEFDGYFRTKWEIAADHPMSFDSSYFESEERSDLYVYLCALVDEDVYDWLEYAYNLTHDEKLSENILHREIYFLKENGTQF